MWYLYTVDYYPTVKKNAIMKFSGKWKNVRKTVWVSNLNPERQTLDVLSHLRS